jgi:hypothetical protein
MTVTNEKQIGSRASQVIEMNNMVITGRQKTTNEGAMKINGLIKME